MNVYDYYRNGRNDRAIYARVLTFEHDIRKRRRRRAALARIGLYLGIATVLCGVLYFVAVGVWVQ